MKIGLGTKIDAIQFTPATAARLERLGIHTIGDLVAHEELISYHPLRSIGLSELTIARLKLDGIETLRGLVEMEERRTKVFHSFPEKLTALSEEKRILLGMPAHTFTWSTRVRNALVGRNYTLADLVVRTERELLDECSYLGKVALTEIKAKLKELGFALRKPL